MTKIVEVPTYVLPSISLNEVSYVALGKEASVEYHNELYGHLQNLASRDDENCFQEKHFECWLVQKGIAKDATWTRIGRNGVVQPPYQCTLPTRIRNFIHHPENHENGPRFTETDLVRSIEMMRKLILSLA